MSSSRVALCSFIGGRPHCRFRQQAWRRDGRAEEEPPLSTPSCRELSLRRPGLEIDDEIVLLDPDLERVGHIGPPEKLQARFDCHMKLPRPDGFRITPGLSRTDIELPAVPGATDELPRTRQAIFPGRARLRQADDHASAQLGALVRTAVGQGKIFAADIEEADLAAACADNLAAARLDLAGARNDLAAHCRP